MTPEILQVLAQLPISMVLIYLLVRSEARNTELMNQICNITAQHSKDILQLTIEFANKISECAVLVRENDVVVSKQ